MTWKFGNMYQISFGNIKHVWKPRNQNRNRKPRNLFYVQVNGLKTNITSEPTRAEHLEKQNQTAKKRRANNQGAGGS